MKIIAGIFLVILSVGLFTFTNDSKDAAEALPEEEIRETRKKKILNREPSSIPQPEIVSASDQRFVPQEEYVPSYANDPNDCVNNPGGESCQSYSGEDVVEYEGEPEMVDNVFIPEQSLESPEVASEAIVEDESV